MQPKSTEMRELASACTASHESSHKRMRCGCVDVPASGVEEHTPVNKLERRDTWKTGGERMTDRQREYLEALCLDREEPFDPILTKAEAAARIEELKNKPKVDMTPEQEVELKALCTEIGLFFNPNLSKGAAAVKIEKIRARMAMARAAQLRDLAVSGQGKRARLARDVSSAIHSHPKGTEVAVVEERGATGFCLMEVAMRKHSVILEVEAAALEIL